MDKLFPPPPKLRSDHDGKSGHLMKELHRNLIKLVLIFISSRWCLAFLPCSMLPTSFGLLLCMWLENVRRNTMWCLSFISQLPLLEASSTGLLPPDLEMKLVLPLQRPLRHSLKITGVFSNGKIFFRYTSSEYFCIVIQKSWFWKISLNMLLVFEFLLWPLTSHWGGHFQNQQPIHCMLWAVRINGERGYI